MERAKSFDTHLLSIILFLYPIEQFQIVHIEHLLGSFSPFRMVILPLCLIYIIYSFRYGLKSVGANIFGAIIFFLFSLIGTFNSGNASSFFSFIGNIVQFTMAYMLIKNMGFQKENLYVMTIWTLSQVPSLIIAFFSNGLGMSRRFCGLFFDPNYLCAFVIAGIVSAAILYSRETNKFLKYYNLAIVILGFVMVFMSFSRGGMLSLLLIVLYFLFVKKKSLFFLLLGLLVLIIPVLYARAQSLTWQDGADSFFNGFLYRTFTLSGDMSELTAGRSDYAAEFFNHIDEYLFIGTDLFTYFDTYNHGGFIHNGFLEILIQGGILAGGFFIVIILMSLVKIFFYSWKYKMISTEALICLGIFVSLSTLSFTSKIAWLCMGLFIGLSSKQVFMGRCH